MPTDAVDRRLANRQPEPDFEPRGHRVTDFARQLDGRHWWACLLCLCRQLSDRFEAWRDPGSGSYDCVRQAEVTAAKTMIRRTVNRFDTRPKRLAANNAYGSAEMLARPVDERGIEPHISVFDKSVLAAGDHSESARPALASRVRGDLAYLEGAKKVIKTGRASSAR